MENKDSEDVVVSPESNDSLKIYARIRKIMPWEPNKKAIKFTKKNIEASSLKGRDKCNSYEFSEVYAPSHDNRHCFENICKPMAMQVLSGFNAVLIAYGQTGSGKTHSLLGKPKRGVLGILPMVMEFFLKCENVKVTLGAVEAFGHHVNKIELYDLFNENSQSRNWSEKMSKTTLNERDMKFVIPNDGQHAIELVSQAQKASHFAPTGKNPESSRGHISFIVKVVQENKAEYQKLESYFVIVDLAGSEGETAFTPEFKKKVDPSTLMARRLEAGVINSGLSQLQIIFNELKVKGRLSGMRGVGLRRVLHQYINTKCVLSVLFCISPSKVNQRSTIATLKFAVQAGMVKVKPVKEAIMTNWPMLVKGLKKMIEALNVDIDERDKQIEAQDNEIDRLMDALGSSKVNGGVDVTINRGHSDHHIRSRSKLPENISVLLVEVDKSDEERDFDAKETADIDEYEVDAAMKEQINYARGEKEAVAAVLGIEKEEFIRKSTIFTSTHMKDSLKLPAYASEAQMNFGYADGQRKSPVETIDFERDQMDTDALTTDQLRERCEVLESMLEAEKSLNESYLYSQQVIIDHLADTNEGLLQFFRVKFKLLDTTKKKKKRKKKSKD